MKSILACAVLVFVCAYARAQTFRNATHLLTIQSDVSRTLTGGAAVDVNSDGLVDLYHAGRLYMQQRDGTFINGLPGSGINDTAGQVQGAVWADANGDGFVDFFPANLTHQSFLHRNHVLGRFRGVSDGPVLEQGATSPVWADFNGDDRLDLFVSDASGNNRLFLQSEDGSLRQAGAFSLRTGRKSCGAAASDFNEDGLMDIYLAGCDTSRIVRSADSVFRNSANGIFTDIVANGEISPTHRYTRSVLWIDYNNDGRQDAFVLQHQPDVTPGGFIPHGFDELYRNDGESRFTRVGQAVGIAGGSDEQGYAAAAADFDNDGWIDVLVLNWPATRSANSTRDHLFRNTGDGSFEDIWGRSIERALLDDLPEESVCIVADVNNDGWIDIFFISRFGNRLLLNNGGSNHWLKVSLRGTAGNYFGVGARVEVYEKGRMQLREIQAGEGYASQNHNMTAHFGLGPDSAVDSVVVRWPRGHADRVLNVSSNQWITVVEGAGKNSPPAAPILTSPADGSRISFGSAQVDFTWQSVDDPDGDPVTFDLFLSGPSLDTVITDLPTPHASLTTSVLRQGEKYVWTVAARDAYSVRRSSEIFSWSFAGSTVFPALAELLPFPGIEWGDLDLADYNGDNNLDILVVGRGKTGAVAEIYEAFDTTAFEGEYVFTYTAYRPVQAGLLGVEGGSAEWGDFDGDGDLDILLTGIPRQSINPVPTTFLYENDGHRFRAYQNLGIPGVISGKAIFGDYDGDGDLDILVTGATRETYPYDPITRVYENTGAGFRDTGADLEAVYLSSAAWGDYDLDGDLDVVISGDRGNGDLVTHIYRNDGGARFTIVASLPGLAFGSMDWGDFDGDGDLDLIVAGSRFDPELFHGWVRIYRNDAGSFQEVPLERDFAQLGMGTALWTDYDGDGDLDIAVIGSETPFRPAQLFAYRNENGRFAIEFSAGGLLNASMVAGDYNGDGDIDLVAMGRADDGEPRLVIFLNQIYPDVVPRD